VYLDLVRILEDEPAVDVCPALHAVGVDVNVQQALLHLLIHQELLGALHLLLQTGECAGKVTEEFS